MPAARDRTKYEQRWLRAGGCAVCGQPRATKTRRFKRGSKRFCRKHLKREPRIPSTLPSIAASPAAREGQEEVTRADQAGLVVQDIARSSVIPKHRYKLDAKTRAVIAISAKTPLAPGKPRRGAKNRTTAPRARGARKTAKKRPN